VTKYGKIPSKLNALTVADSNLQEFLLSRNIKIIVGITAMLKNTKAGIERLMRNNKTIDNNI
jgi:hypothetical protein